MITDLTQLEGALEQIAWAADALEGMRRGVNEENALIFPVAAEAYVQQIREITTQARDFLQTSSQTVEGRTQNGKPNTASCLPSSETPSDKVAA